MEASDLLHSPIFGSAHSLTDRTNLNSSAMTSDSAASLLFARNVISGFGGSVTTAAANRSPASTRPSVLSTSTVSNNHNSSAGAAATDSMSICQMNNTNAALMNAFGLANGLQLPAGLWENSLFNAALSQYIDANAPLVRLVITMIAF